MSYYHHNMIATITKRIKQCLSNHLKRVSPRSTSSCESDKARQPSSAFDWDTRRNNLAGQLASSNRIKMLHRAIHRKTFRTLGKPRGKVLRNYNTQKRKAKQIVGDSFTIPFLQHEPGPLHSLADLRFLHPPRPGNCYSEPRIYIIHQRTVQAWACIMPNVAESEAVPKTKW